MKPIIHKLAMLVAMQLSFLQASAYDFEVDGIYYNKLDNNEVAVTKSENYYEGDIVIPSYVSYEGVNYSVTTIGYSAFGFCRNLTSIKISDSVTSIGEYAFEDCFGLTSIEIPNSVTVIEEYAFISCRSLTDIEIPNSVTAIANGLFVECTGLTSVVLPNSVTYIGERAFEECSSLRSIKIPNSVTYIDYGAFRYCSNLTEIYSYADTPPVCATQVFYSVDKQQCTLYVPNGHVDEYRAADQWKDFLLIEGVESGIEDVISDPADEVYNVYNLNGVRVLTTIDKADLQQLAAGIYVINGKKYVIR